jgi:predicted phosphodiesterase
MKTYDIGDWHLSDGTGPSALNHRRMNDFLDLVGDDELIVGGDFLDLWRWSADSILKGPARKIIDRVKAKENDTIIIGNHDLDLALMHDIFQKNVVMGCNLFGYQVMHGHQFDKRLDDPKERKMVKAVSLLIQKVNIGLLNQFRDWATSSARSNTVYKEKAATMGMKLLMHHTHVPEISKDWLYLNPGAWVGADCRYIVFEDGVPRLERMR